MRNVQLITAKKPTDLYAGLKRYLAEPGEDHALPFFFFVNSNSRGALEHISLHKGHQVVMGNMHHKRETVWAIRNEYHHPYLAVSFSKQFNGAAICVQADFLSKLQAEQENILFQTRMTHLWSMKPERTIQFVTFFIDASKLSTSFWTTRDPQVLRNKLEVTLKKKQKELLSYFEEKQGIQFASTVSIAPKSIKEDILKKEKLQVILQGILRILLSEQESVMCKQEKEDIGLQKACELLIANFFEPAPTLNELSAIVGVNRRKFQEMFKNKYGFNFYHFYQQKRFEYIEFLIEEKGFNIFESLQLLGIKNQTHFTRQFERFMGKKLNDCKMKKPPHVAQSIID
mgnify:FL=1